MADNNNQTMNPNYQKSLEEFEQLKNAMKQMDIKITEKQEEDLEINREIEELEKVLRKSVTEDDLFNETDDILKSLEEEERKLQEELKLIKSAHQEELNKNGVTEESDDESGEELPTELKNELERTTSNDANWSYPTGS